MLVHSLLTIVMVKTFSWGDKTLTDAVQVVETQTAEMDEEHYTSSSSDSEAESVVLEAPVRVFLPPRALGGYHFMQHGRTKTLHLVDAKFPSGTCCGRVLDQNFRTFSCPCN